MENYDPQSDAPPPPLPHESEMYANQPIEKQPQPQQPVTDVNIPRSAPVQEKGTLELAKLRHDWADIRTYFDSLDIEQVSTWDYLEVAERFLRPINLPRLKQIFVEHKIYGATLFGLDKRDLKEMKIMAVGDRVMITNSVAYLKRLKDRHDKNRKVWEGVVPYGKVAYYKNFFDMLAHKCCPCCTNTDKYKITPVSIRKRLDPPTCNCRCEGISHDNNDLRFLKDVDWSNRIFCWCCSKNVITMMFEIDENDGPFKIEFAHPEVGDELVSTIQDLWAAQRLVAD